MQTIDLLQNHLMEECPYIHSKRLQALMDVACGLQKRQKLTLTEMGRGLPGETSIEKYLNRVVFQAEHSHFYLP